MDAATVLAGPEYFDCERLAARISGRQCLLNQGKASGLRPYPYLMGDVRVCLDCPQGRDVRAYPSGIGQPRAAPAGEEILTPTRKAAKAPETAGERPHGLEPGATETKMPAALRRQLAGATPSVRRALLAKWEGTHADL